MKGLLHKIKRNSKNSKQSVVEAIDRRVTLLEARVEVIERAAEAKVNGAK